MTSPESASPTSTPGSADKQLARNARSRGRRTTATPGANATLASWGPVEEQTDLFADTTDDKSGQD